MKNTLKGLMLMSGFIVSIQTFSQHRHDDRRGRDNNVYRSYPKPYSYPSSRPSVSVIARLPFGAIAVNFGSRHYHYHEGVYYEPVYGGYSIIEAPVGVIVPVLPPNSVYIIIGGRSYYRYGSVYYMPVDNSHYQVVAQPMEEIPITTNTNNNNSNGYEKFVLEGKTYYKKGGKYYKARIAENGEVIYEEVGMNVN